MLTKVRISYKAEGFSLEGGKFLIGKPSCKVLLVAFLKDY